MKKIVVSFLLVCLSTMLSAQSEQVAPIEQSEQGRDSLSAWTQATRLRLIVDDMPGVVVQDSAIYNLLDRKVNGSDQHVATIDGYRVQVYSSNRQQEAKQEALQLAETLRGKVSEPIYVQYVTPFWKVRIGNFRTLQDASAYRTELGQLFPDILTTSYVVRDQIEVLL